MKENPKVGDELDDTIVCRRCRIVTYVVLGIAVVTILGWALAASITL